MEEILERLKYMLLSYTQTTISNLTSIPQSTLSYVVRGLRDLNSMYYAAVYKVWAALSYSNLFNLGAPSYYASLLSHENVTAVKNAESYITQVADALTMGYIVRQAAIDDEEIDQDYIDEKWAVAYNDIINSLRASTKPVKEWRKDYLDIYWLESI